MASQLQQYKSIGTPRMAFITYTHIGGDARCSDCSTHIYLRQFV